MRKSGILMHITSLPGPEGVGTLGEEAFAFADFLKKAGMTLWQVLPMGPTGYGESPYQSASVFAGNPLLISLHQLRKEGLLTFEDNEIVSSASPDQVDYAAVRANKDMLLRRAFVQSEKQLLGQIRQFLRDNRWVEDFALFTAIKEHFGQEMWQKWPDNAIRLREKEALIRYRVELDDEVRFHVYCQFIFRRQWMALRQYCNERGLQLFGDMPIYVAEDSADAWTNPDIFQMDKDRRLTRVAGVPPDYFSADGQLWGNPLYRWNYLALRGYDWWVKRMKHMEAMYDVVRIDHFIGFANYYSIPHGAPNARTGKWIIGPGKLLFIRLKQALPHMQVIAEDLGEVNDRVRKLLKFVGYPGMRVLCFGFGGGDDNMHLSEQYVENCVAYTGTHDNDTVRGWVDTADEKSLLHAKTLLGFDKPEDAPDAFIRAVMASRADTAMIPMQDALGLPGTARMNTPGTIGGNWAWRMSPGAASDTLAARLMDMNIACNRRNEA